MIRYMLMGACIAGGFAHTGFSSTHVRMLDIQPGGIHYTFYIPGHSFFCSETPACETYGPAREILTPERWYQLESINREVNRRFEQEEEPPGRDRWSVMTAIGNSGDCEDFAVTKRHWLIALGWSPRALLVARVNNMRGNPHAVLVVRTDRGDLVLDMYYDRIMPWYQNSAKAWLAITDPDDFSKWRWIADTSPQEMIL